MILLRLFFVGFVALGCFDSAGAMVKQRVLTKKEMEQNSLQQRYLKRLEAILETLNKISDDDRELLDKRMRDTDRICYNLVQTHINRLRSNAYTMNVLEMTKKLLQQCDEELPQIIAAIEKAKASKKEESGLSTDVKRVLRAARESVRDVTLTPMDQEIYDFLERYVRQCYIPSVLKGREISLWSDVFHEAICMSTAIKENYERNRFQFYKQLIEKYFYSEEKLAGFSDEEYQEKIGVVEKRINEAFQRVVPIFFKALHDIFASRGYSEEYRCWLKTASEYFYGLLIKKHPGLALSSTVYKDSKPLPEREGGILKESLSILGKLDELNLDETENQ